MPERPRGKPPSTTGLMAQAEKARANAYARYSHFRVGTALLAKDGRVFLGVNVENISYGITMCAERVALGNAVSAGAREFVAVAVAGPKGEVTPCGACRQALMEFSPDLRVSYRTAAGRIASRRLRDLLPLAFTFTPKP